MTSAFESAVNEALSRLEQQREEMLRRRKEFGRGATPATRQRGVSVTVDEHGDIVGLRFRDQSYRHLAPDDLAKLILDAIDEARRAWPAQKSELPAEAVAAEAERRDRSDSHED